MYCDNCIHADMIGIPLCKLHLKANLGTVIRCDDKEEKDE